VEYGLLFRCWQVSFSSKLFRQYGNKFAAGITRSPPALKALVVPDHQQPAWAQLSATVARSMVGVDRPPHTAK
jgi:hypothetical protein